MVERVEVAATALVKESAATPAAPVVMSSPHGVEAHPQEVTAASAGLAPPAPVLTATAEATQPPEPPVHSAAAAPPILAPRTSSPLLGVQPGHGTPATSGALEEARAALNLLQGELWGPDGARPWDYWG